MSGAIMPAPLAMPLIVTLALPIFALAVATLGKVSVVMIAWRRVGQSAGAALRATKPAMTPSKTCAFNGSPITPVEAEGTVRRFATNARAAICGGEPARRRGRSCR